MDTGYIVGATIQISVGLLLIFLAIKTFKRARSDRKKTWLLILNSLIMFITGSFILFGTVMGIYLNTSP
jgi:hypothetical protein